MRKHLFSLALLAVLASLAIPANAQILYGSVVSGYRFGHGSEVPSMQQLQCCFGLPRFEFPAG